MVIEQELFYPAVLRVKEDLILEGYEEHAAARFALKRLMKTEPSDRTFKPNPKAAEVYNKLYPLYRRLHDTFGRANRTDALGDIMKSLLEIRDAAKA